MGGCLHHSSNCLKKGNLFAFGILNSAGQSVRPISFRRARPRPRRTVATTSFSTWFARPRVGVTRPRSLFFSPSRQDPILRDTQTGCFLETSAGYPEEDIVQRRPKKKHAVYPRPWSQLAWSWVMKWESFQCLSRNPDKGSMTRPSAPNGCFRHAACEGRQQDLKTVWPASWFVWETESRP